MSLGQAEVVALGEELRADPALLDDVAADVARGHRALERILGASDGFQVGGDRTSTAHHAANVLFNDMRGGVFAQGYDIERDDFIAFVGERNRRGRRPGSARRSRRCPRRCALQDLRRRLPDERRHRSRAPRLRVPAADLQPPARRPEPPVEPLQHPAARTRAASA